MKRRILLIEIGPKLFLTGVLPSAALNTAYNASVSARGGSAPYRYEVIEGALPSGWALEPFSGVISGTTDAPGLYTFTVQATDARGATARKTFSIRVQAEPLQITGTYPNGTVDTAYSADLIIGGGVPPYANPHVISGDLPPGLDLTVVDDKLRLSGAPTSVFDGSFVVGVDDAAGTTARSAQALKMTALADPYRDQVLLLLHFNGEDGSQSYIDEVGTIWAPSAAGWTAANLSISTAFSKFGGASGKFWHWGSGGETSPQINPKSPKQASDYNVGAGDVTIECWLMPQTPIPTGNVGFFYQQGINVPGTIQLGADPNRVYVRLNGTTSFNIPASISTTKFTHFAYVRAGGVSTVYLDGVAIWTQNVSFNNTVGIGQVLYIGGNASVAYFGFNGYIDEFRVTKMARYTANFVPPSAPFPY